MRTYKSNIKPMDFSALMAQDAQAKQAMAALSATVNKEPPEDGGIDNIDSNIDALTSDENIAAIPTQYDAYLEPDYSFGDGPALTAGPSDGFITSDASVGNYDLEFDDAGFDLAPPSVGSSIDSLSSDANLEAAAQNIFEYNPESNGFLDLMKKGRGIFQ